MCTYLTNTAIVHPPNVNWNYTAAQGMDSANSDNYTVVISFKLAEVQYDVLYSVNVTPAALAIHCHDNTTFNVMLSYGNAYYVVVTATSTLCRSISASLHLGWISIDYTVETMYGE